MAVLKIITGEKLKLKTKFPYLILVIIALIYSVKSILNDNQNSDKEEINNISQILDKKNYLRYKKK
jgi:hypothetical protein